MSSVLIGLLGPPVLRVGGRDVSLGPPRQRAVLGFLALHAGRAVSRDDLVDAVWGQDAPASVVGNLHTHVSALRRTLRAVTGGSGPLVTLGTGYLLDVADDAVDALRFEHLLRSADHAWRGGDPTGAHARWRQALSLWRGTPLTGLAAPYAEGERTRLTRALVSGAGAFAEALLASGAAEDALAVVGPVGDEHPSDQRLAAVRVRALAAAGRHAQAAVLFERTRDLLGSELGLDPSPDLLRTHEAVALSRPPSRTRLPAEPAGFTGRTRDAAAVEDWWASANGERLAVCAVDGPPGAGKTALALHVAHRLGDRFRDGAHLLDLSGRSDPGAAVTSLLDVFGGAPDPVPPDLDELAGAYRSRLATRQVLLVLDGARSAEQVRPLLAGGPGSLVVVTSRFRLGGLSARDGALGLSLGGLDVEAAAALLGRAPADAAELTRLCAGNPLALRLAATRDHEGLVTALGDDATRLRVLDGEDGGPLTTAFTRIADDLDADPAELLALLGAQPCRALTAAAAGALTGWPVPRARRALDALAVAHLADWEPGGGYGQHALARSLSVLRSRSALTATDRDAAERRLIEWYAEATRRVPDATALPAREHDNLALLSARAEARGDHATARALLDRLARSTEVDQATGGEITPLSAITQATSPPASDGSTS
ncbi:BTAD domain-containing putative transcriptional regulator [Saccharothrix sp. Mg75]|uniref:AfsR/SARP family transcriptional regulator n=1 Tax=Saccharothrix sp. Mg75 TaxID=3445357 RepID=UPI003EECFB1F